MHRRFVLPRSLITSWTYAEGRGDSTTVERDRQVLISQTGQAEARGQGCAIVGEGRVAFEMNVSRVREWYGNERCDGSDN